LSLEVIEEKQNSLLGRREAKLVVHHEGQGTPDRISVRKLASQHFNADFDRVYVRSISTRTGGSSALCVVEVYQDKKSAEVVPDYLKNRNLPKDQRVSKKKKEEAPKPAAPAPKPAAEKKTEKAPEPKPEKKTEAKPAEKKEEAKTAPAKEAKPAGKAEKPAAKEAKPAKPEKPKT
jgi:ribosomal protein S24E